MWHQQQKLRIFSESVNVPQGYGETWKWVLLILYENLYYVNIKTA